MDDEPEIDVLSEDAGLGVVLLIHNPGRESVRVAEPHPNTSVRLVDPGGVYRPKHVGVFVANRRWYVTVKPGETRRRVVLLAPFFIDARGEFVAACFVRCWPPVARPVLAVRGPVMLALPTADEYADPASPARVRMARYAEAGCIHPLLSD